MDKQTKQKLIIGGVVIATLLILWILFSGRANRAIQVLDGNGDSGDINVPGLAPIQWNDVPPLIYTPAELVGFDFGINYTPSNPYGGLQWNGNLPIENGPRECERNTQAPLVIRVGGGGFASSGSSSSSNDGSNWVMPFAWGR